MCQAADKSQGPVIDILALDPCLETPPSGKEAEVSFEPESS